MGLFNTLMSKIFSHPAASTAGATTQPAATGSAPSSATTSPGAQAPASTPSTSAATGAGTQTVSAGAAAPAAKQVDVAAVLNAMAAKNPEKLDWKHSIVDLMKLVGMDSSLSARKELATDLHYTGDQNDSASMNVWLHKEVLRKLSENGGNVPPDLLKK
jgi:hypothetical protein